MSDQRVIRYGDRELPLEAGMTLDQAKELMARHFPELADPKIETKKAKDKTTYVFSKKAGHKGACQHKRRITRRRVNANALTVRKLLAAAPTEIVDARLLAHIDRGSTEQIIDGDLAGYLNVEIERASAVTLALLDLPNAMKPSGAVL